MIPSLSWFRKGTTQRSGARRPAVFSRPAAFSGPFALGLLAAALAVCPLAATADEVMSVTRDQIGIGRIDPGGKGNDLFLVTPNANGTSRQDWNHPGQPMPEVRVHVPWQGHRPPRPGPRPPHLGQHPDGRADVPGRQPPRHWEQPPDRGQRPPHEPPSAPGRIQPYQWEQPSARPGQP